MIIKMPVVMYVPERINAIGRGVWKRHDTSPTAMPIIRRKLPTHRLARACPIQIAIKKRTHKMAVASDAYLALP